MTDTRILDGRASARSLAIVAAMAMVFALLPLAGIANAFHPDGAPDAVEAERFDGQQRFDTAAKIATRTFDTSGTVLIARADQGMFPDSLAGNYLAGRLGVPVLLLVPNQTVGDTMDALEELEAEHLIILGGEAAISASVEAELQAAGYTTDRVGGVHRWETAADIARTGADDGSDIGTWEDDRTAIVASGQNFPDALVSGGLSYDQQFPLLLTPQAFLVDDARNALDDLGIEHVIIPGGVAAVSALVEAEIVAMGIEVTRRWGPSRVETALDFADFVGDEFGWTYNHVNVARSNDFPDALTMGPHMGEETSPMLLNHPDTPHPLNLEWLQDHACESLSLHIAGGLVAISQAVEDAFVAAASDCPPVQALRLSPETATNVIGFEHTVTAEVGDFVVDDFRGGDEDVDVRFELYREVPPANPGDDVTYVAVDTEETTTDEDGRAEYSYVYDEDSLDLEEESAFFGETSDIIVACVTDEAVAGEDAGDPCAELELDETDPLNPVIVGVEARDDPFADDAEKDWVEADVTYEDIVLSSTNETGDAEDADPEITGTATVALNTDTNTICWDIEMDTAPEDGPGSYENSPGAHLHEAPAAADGPIVVFFEHVDDETLRSEGCVTNPEDAGGNPFDVTEVQDDPDQFYVNVHSENYPAGAARGQLA